MKSLFKACAIVSLVAVGGCVPFWRSWMKPDGPPPLPYSVLPQHESWCYKTLAEADCYPEPQRLPPESLVSVDPPSRFPLTRADHARALEEVRAAKK